MDDDDLKLQHVEAKFQHRNLAVLSLDMLAEYITELEAEIARAREGHRRKGKRPRRRRLGV